MALPFMPFPAVTGGQGSIDQYPANAGSPNVINAKLYGPNGQAWLKCIAANYGSASLKDQGTFSGFKVNTPVASLPPLTARLPCQFALAYAALAALFLALSFTRQSPAPRHTE